MFRKLLCLFLTAGFVVALAGTAAAFEQGNERKGKYMFRKNCRSCHTEGASAEPLNPISKTQAQWERAFQRYERFECADQWEELSQSDRNDILTYLYNHAFDSPSPATCE